MEVCWRKQAERRPRGRPASSPTEEQRPQLKAWTCSASVVLLNVDNPLSPAHNDRRSCICRPCFEIYAEVTGDVSCAGCKLLNASFSVTVAPAAVQARRTPLYTSSAVGVSGHALKVHAASRARLSIRSHVGHREYH